MFARGEAAFLACSFWLVDNCILQWRPAEARKLFDCFSRAAMTSNSPRRDTALESVRLLGGDPKPSLSAGIERTISRYPRTIDFGSSNRQNDDHSERARCNMNTDLNYATGKFSRTIRFVLVNNRVPRSDQHCALCNRLMEKATFVIHRRG